MSRVVVGVFSLLVVLGLTWREARAQPCLCTAENPTCCSGAGMPSDDDFPGATGPTDDRKPIMPQSGPFELAQTIGFPLPWNAPAPPGHPRTPPSTANNEQVAEQTVLEVVQRTHLAVLGFTSPGPALSSQPRPDTSIVPTAQGSPKANTPTGDTKTTDELDPIDVITGELVISHVDLELPGFGVPFRLTRTYRSRIDYEGPFGPGWDFNYNQRLVAVEQVTLDEQPAPATYPGLALTGLGVVVGDLTYACGPVVALSTGQGTTIQFREIARNGSAIEYRSQAAHLELAGQIDSGNVITWTLRSPIGDVRHFDGAGHLVRWVDANGIGLTLAWSGTEEDARLSTVTDSVGRVITFQYDASNRIDLVSEPTSELDADYTYAAHGGLEVARRADGRSERYLYDVDPARTRGEWLAEEQLRPACASACRVSDATCTTGGACDDAVNAAAIECLDWIDDGCSNYCEGSCRLGCAEACEPGCETFCADPTQEPFFGTQCLEMFGTANVEAICGQCEEACYWYAYQEASPPAVCVDPPAGDLGNCRENVYECCRGNGDHCGAGSCNTDEWEPCGQACENLWLGWQNEGTAMSQCPGVADLARDSTGCLPKARAACIDRGAQGPGTCAIACATTPIDASTPSCADACDAQCPGLCTPALCAEQDFAGTCADACTEECIEDGRDAHGQAGPRYGHLADLNFNIVQIEDGAGQIYLTNTYEHDPASPSFDAITHQQFGSYAGDLFRRDLVAGLPTSVPSWVPTPAFETVDICPYTCQPDPWAPLDIYIPWGELILVVPPGPVAVGLDGFTVNRGALSSAVLPTLVTFTPGAGGSVTGTIHRRTSATNYLATTAVSIPLTLDAGATVTLATSSNGNVTVTGSAAAKQQLLDMKTMTLFTVPGRFLRAYPGKPAEVLVVSSGACSGPFQLQTVSETEAMITPVTACSGELWVTPMAGVYPTVSESDDFLTRGLGALTTTAFHPTTLAPARAGGVWRRGIEGRWVREPAPSGAGIGVADRAGIASYAQTPMFSAPTTASVTEPLYVFHHVQADFTVTSPPPAPSDLPWESLDPIPTIDITCDPTLPGAARRGSGPVPTQSTTIRDFHGATIAFYADEQNNLLRVTNHATSSTWSFNYDPIGQLTAIEAPDGARTCMTYDTKGNVTQRLRLPSTQPNVPTPQPIIETFAYRASDSRLLSISDPRTGTPMRTFAWDTAGNLQSMTEAGGAVTTFGLVGGTGPARAQIASARFVPSGSETRFGYDTTNATLATTTVDPTGALPLLEEYAHDDAGRLRVHVGPRGLERTFSYDGAFLAARGWTGDGHTGSTAITVNGDGRIATETTGPLQISYGYSAIGTYTHVTRTATDASSTRCFDIGPDDRVRETVSAQGIRTRTTYDGMGNVTRVDAGDLGPSVGTWDDACLDHPTGGTEVFVMASASYDTSGRLRTYTDARGMMTTITRDGHGHPIMERRPDDSQVWRGFDALGNVIWESVYSPLAVPASYRGPSWSDTGLRSAVEIAYDNRGRVREIKRWHFDASNAPVGDGYSVETIAYDDVARTVTRMDDANQSWVTRYDRAGRVTSEVAPDGITRTYDHLSERAIRVSEPGATGTLAREVALTAWGAVASDFAVRASVRHELSTTQFDDLLRPTSTTSATGARADISYDGFGRVRRTTSTVPGGNGESVSFLYDGDDRLVTRVSDASGVASGTWNWNHDALGRETIAQDPLGRRTTTSYISGSTLPFQVTDPRGVITTHAWTPLGQPAIISADGQSDVQLAYSWDALGRLRTATRTDQGQAAITTTLAWDSLGGKVREEDNVLGAANARNAIFDGRGLPIRTNVGSTTLTRTFDNLGRLERMHVNSETNPIAQYTYAGFDIPLTRKVNNAIETQLTYDDLGRLVRQRDLRLPNTTLADWTWQVPFDGAPRRAQTTRSGIATHTSTFTVDPIARLTAEDDVSTTPVTLTSTTSFSQAHSAAQAALSGSAWEYQLDGRAGWMSREQGAATTTYSRDAGDALMQVGAQSLSLDLRGAVTSDGTTALQYDALGMVSRVTTSTLDRTYKRDALGRIVTETSSAGVTKYGFDGPTRILRQRPDNTIDLTVDGAHLDEHVAILTGTARDFLFQDPLGSVYLTTNKTNVIREWASYTAYGEPTLRTPAGGVIPTSNIAAQYGFQGLPHDFATGFVDMRARMYRPTWGRFVSPDPLGLIDGTNRFAFVGSRPLTYIDPFGLDGAKTGVSSHVDAIERVSSTVLSFVGKLTHKMESVRHRAVGGLKVAGGAAMFKFGADLCGLGACLLGVPLMGFGSDVAGAGATQMWSGEPERSTIGLISPAAQELEEQLVFAGGFVGPMAQVAVGARLQLLATHTNRSAAESGFKSLDDAALSSITGGTNSVRPGQAGAYADLRGVTGDSLTPHHMPQAALEFTSRAEGGALVLPHHEHVLTRTYGGRGAATLRTDANLPFRAVLARDMHNIRSIFGPKYDQGLRDLLAYYYNHFPWLIKK